MIYFAGDLHGKFGRLIDAVERDRPNAVVLLGDIEATEPLHIALAKICSLTELWFLHGNHDTDSRLSWKNLTETELAHRNLHGRVVEIDGVKVAGLGGVFRGEIWSPPEPASFVSFHDFEKKRLRPSRGPQDSDRVQDGKRLKHMSTIFPETYSTLLKQRADILVSHEAPGCHPHGFSAIDDLAASMRVRSMFHGHQHDNLDYAEWSRQHGIQAFGVGLRGITDQNGTVIVAGELDEARRYRNFNQEKKST
jgi:predicted phosphodiesterase